MASASTDARSPAETPATTIESPLRVTVRCEDTVDSRARSVATVVRSDSAEAPAAAVNPSADDDPPVAGAVVTGADAGRPTVSTTATIATTTATASAGTSRPVRRNRGPASRAVPVSTRATSWRSMRSK